MMYCNAHLTSTYLCGCDCDNASKYSTSMRAKSSTSCREPPHEPSCCCNYNPFTDGTKSAEIHDPGFAQRKLAVMKCQMKKWYIERLRSESETRSLKKTMQSLGVDMQSIPTEDPLIKHYRDENNRLEKVREQLEERIKDIEMTISEQEDKMRMLREQSSREIKILEETKKELLMKLADFGGESSCAGVNRLRARLRELMDQLEKKEAAESRQQTDIIDETREQRGTQSSNHQLMDDTEMKTKLRECNNLIEELRREVIEKNNTIRNLERKMAEDMGTMRMNHESLIMQVTRDKEQLKKCEKKVEELMNQLGQDRPAVLEFDRAKSGTDIVLRQLDDIEVEQHTLDKDIEINKVLNGRDVVLRDALAKSTELQGRIDDLVRQEILSRKEIEELKNERLILQNRLKHNGEVTSKLTNLRRESGSDEQKDDEYQELTTRPKLSGEGVEKIGDRSQMELIETSDLVKSQDPNLLNELNKCQDEYAQLNAAVSENEALKKRIVDMMRDIDAQKNEISIDALEIEKLNRQLENAKKKLELSQGRMSEFDDESTHLQQRDGELGMLKEALAMKKAAKNAASGKSDSLNDELHALKNELKTCRNENEKLRKELNDSERQCLILNEDLSNFQTVIKEMKTHNDVLVKDNDLLKHEVKKHVDQQTQKVQVDALEAENDMLKSDSERLRSENFAIKNDLTNLANFNENLSSKLATLESEILQCNSEKGKLTSEFQKFRDDHLKQKNEYDSTSKELEALTKSVKNNENQARESESNLNALRSEKESLLTALNDMRERMDELKRNIHTKDDELQESTTVKRELVALKNELDKCREELARYKRGSDSSKEQIETLKHDNEVAQHKSQIADKKTNADNSRPTEPSQKRFQQSNKDVDGMEADGAHDNEALEEINALKNTVGKLRKDLEECNVRNGQLHYELDKWENDVKISKTELERVRNENIKFVNELKTTKNQLSHLNREMDEMNLQNSRLEGDLMRMRKEVESTIAERSKLEVQNTAMKRDIDGLLRKHNGNSNESGNHVKDVELTEEIVRLKMENNGLKKELEVVREKLKRVSVRTGQVADEQDNVREDASSGEGYIDSGRSVNEVDFLRRRNEKLSMDLQELRNDINKLKTENEILRADIDDSSKLNNAIVEMKKWRRNAEDLSRENGVLNDKLRLAMEDLEKVKSDATRIFELTNSVQTGTVTEITRPEEVKQLIMKLRELNTEIERLREENELMKSDVDIPSKMKQLLDELDQWKKKVENLERENIMMKGGSYRNDVLSEHPKQNIESHSQISEGRSDTQIISNTLDIPNELIRALDVIRLKMEKQKKGVMRIREKIDNMVKRIWSESSKYTDSDDLIVLNTTNPVIAEVYQLLGSLSTNITRAEKELDNFGEVWVAQWEEEARLEKFVEDSVDIGASESSELSSNRTGENAGYFDPESWLAALTLTELAQLHDKICLLTSNLVVQDSSSEVCEKLDDVTNSSCNGNALQQNYDVLNKRITALQREIQQKQIEAGKKVSEMRQILRREQVELMRISEAMSAEKKRNLILQFAVYEPPCLVYDCTAACAQSVKFIPNIAHKE